LGDFSSIQGCLILGSFLKIAEVHSPNSWATLFHDVNCVLPNLGKNGLGDILGDFFTNPSGHPVRRVHMRENGAFSRDYLYLKATCASN
jgi:hypothetical protein